MAKVGLIGIGNMGSSLLAGEVRKPRQRYPTERFVEKLRKS